MSSQPQIVSPADRRPAIGFAEFVAFIAGLMALNALGIDIMLPALEAMGKALHIVRENDRQWIIAAYVFGFGAAQLIYGPLADRYGRKPVLVTALLFFAAGAVLAAVAWDFRTMMIARAFQGVCAAAARVLAVTIVRDRYAGRQMARVMSLTFIVFLAVPMLAPGIGQLILMFGPWEAIFLTLGGFAVLIAAWAAIRLPESLHAEDRRAISVPVLIDAARIVLTNRTSLGYTLASTILLGGLMGFINSVQQIFADVFGEMAHFPAMFALMTSGMAVGAFLNTRIVERKGMRLISHAALIGFVIIAGIHALTAEAGLETMWTFAAFQAGTMFFFSLVLSNFGALAMEPVGHVAGTASSIQGFVTTLGGAFIGLVIGQQFDGTTVPVALGFAFGGVGALIVVLIVEKGRLFRATHRTPAQ